MSRSRRRRNRRGRTSGPTGATSHPEPDPSSGEPADETEPAGHALQVDTEDAGVVGDDDLVQGDGVVGEDDDVDGDGVVGDEHDGVTDDGDAMKHDGVDDDEGVVEEDDLVIIGRLDDEDVAEIVSVVDDRDRSGPDDAVGDGAEDTADRTEPTTVMEYEDVEPAGSDHDDHDGDNGKEAGTEHDAGDPALDNGDPALGNGVSTGDQVDSPKEQPGSNGEPANGAAATLTDVAPGQSGSSDLITEELDGSDWFDSGFVSQPGGDGRHADTTELDRSLLQRIGLGDLGFDARAADNTMSDPTVIATTTAADRTEGGPGRPWVAPADLEQPEFVGSGGPILRALRRSPWLMVLAVLLPVAAVTAWVVLRSPTYIASARLLIEPISDDDYLRGLPLLRRYGEPTRTVQTAAAMIETREIARRAAEGVDFDISTDEVVETTEITIEGQTNVVRISVVGDDPDEVIALSNAYADAALDVRSEALQAVIDEELETLDARLQALPQFDSETRSAIEQTMSELRLFRRDPTLIVAERASSAEPYAQQPAVISLIVSLLAGLGLAGSLALYGDWRRRDRARTVGEVQAALRVPVLSEVPGRFGPPGFAHSTSATDDPSFRALRHRLQALSSGDGGWSMTIAGLSSPADSCYVVANLGRDLARSGVEVAVIDLDPDADWKPLAASHSSTTGLPPDAVASTEPSVNDAARPASFEPAVSFLDLTAGDSAAAVLSGAAPGPRSPWFTAVEALNGTAGPGCWVMVNAPSPSSSEVSLQLSPRAPILLVVRLDETTFKTIRVVGDLLAGAGAKVLGVVVINDALRGRRAR